MLFSKKLKPELFRAMREQAGLTREQLAKEMKWSVRTVYNYETNENKMSLSDFERFLMVTAASSEEMKERVNLLENIVSSIEKLVAPVAKTGKKA